MKKTLIYKVFNKLNQQNLNKNIGGINIDMYY